MRLLAALVPAIIVLSCIPAIDEEITLRTLGTEDLVVRIDTTGSPDASYATDLKGKDYDFGRSVQPTEDGGYVLVGYTSQSDGDNYDILLIKASSTGVREWSRKFGGRYDDKGWSVQPARDGGYVIVGSTKSYGEGGEDLWLIKTDENGNERWNRTFGGPNDDRGWSVQQTRDGGYIIAGATSSYVDGGSDAWLIKTGADGRQKWSKTFGGSGWSEADSVRQTSDGGYILTGWTAPNSADSRALLLIKTKANGEEEWAKTAVWNGWEEGDSVQQTEDGGYIVSGGSGRGNNAKKDLLLIKTGAEGDEEERKVFGGAGWEEGFSVCQATDGGYIIAGTTNSFGAGKSDLWLVKVDASGEMAWNRTFGGPGIDEGYSISQTGDEGYIITGVTSICDAESYDAWLVKIDSKGDEEWNSTFGGSTGDLGEMVTFVSNEPSGLPEESGRQNG